MSAAEHAATILRAFIERNATQAHRVIAERDALVAAHDRLVGELADWKQEAERRGLPKELMQRLYRAERELADARAALTGLPVYIGPNNERCWCLRDDKQPVGVHWGYCLAVRAVLAGVRADEPADTTETP